MKIEDLDFYSLPELWYPISGFDEYEVSDHGRVRHVARPDSFLKLRRVAKGYLVVRLYIDGIRYVRRVHRLVAQAIWPNPGNELPLVRHLDGNPASNHFLNLAWGTDLENYEDARRHGTHPAARLKKAAHA